LFGEEIYYYQHNIEVDFYVPSAQLAVQVCYSLSNNETRKREIQALVKMSSQIDVATMLIITKDEDETIKENGLSIQIIPAWKWLCQGSALI